MASLTPNQQETLTMFISMTNADTEVAKAFLKACSWDVNTATDRFFTFGGDVSKLKPPSSNRPPPINPNQPGIMSNAAAVIQNSFMSMFGGGAQGIQPQPIQPMQPMMQPMMPAQAPAPANNNNNINNNNNNTSAIGGGGGGGAVGGASGGAISQMDADALLAQQLAAQSQPPQQPQIRRPDLAFQDQLVGPYTNQYGSSLRKQRQDAEKNFAKDWERGPKNPKSSFLGALFSDPTYKFKGSLEDAKKSGLRQNKWLLVNIQDTENFTSHVLNRDIWKGKEIEDVVKASFVFYQWTRTTDNARRVINLYHLRKFPCIFILDPNTGRKEHEFIVPNQPDKVITLKAKILEFLDNYPNPKAKPKKVITHAPATRDIAPQSHEDKMLQEAIQASLMENENTDNSNTVTVSKPNGSVGNDGDDNNDNMESINDEKQQMEVDEPEEEEAPQPQLQLDPQPDMNDKNATAIRVRMPNGSILQRRFKKTTKVEQLYIWLMLSLNNGKKVSLIQTMPRMHLNEEKGKTLQELGLIRATLVCSYDD